MSDLIKRITKVIDTLINSNALFTMLDVSNKLKQDGGAFISHTDVREAGNPIVQLLVGRGYMKEEITVATSNGPTRAMLYYPVNSNPNAYTNRSQVASGIGAASVSLLNPGQSASLPSQKNSLTIAQKAASNVVPARSSQNRTFAAMVRNDGKVEIPTAALIEAGLLNEVADFTFHPNSVTIEVGNDRKLYTGIRLGVQSLSKSNLSQSKVLKFTAFRKKIVVSA
jgi:hypothetical protein